MNYNPKSTSIFGSVGSTIKFFLLFLVIFFTSFGTLYFLGLVPSELEETNELSSVPVSTPRPSGAPIVAQKGEVPLRIVVPALGIDSPIRNPSTTDVNALDEELKKGVVRYPGSGLGGEGNMLLFGHGSNLAVVNNKAFKVFTELKKLKEGNEIRVISQEMEYVYKVRKVSLLEASNVKVEFNTDRNILTLATCNTFGGKERYVVESDFVSSKRGSLSHFRAFSGS